MWVSAATTTSRRRRRRRVVRRRRVMPQRSTGRRRSRPSRRTHVPAAGPQLPPPRRLVAVRPRQLGKDSLLPEPARNRHPTLTASLSYWMRFTISAVSSTHHPSRRVCLCHANDSSIRPWKCSQHGTLDLFGGRFLLAHKAIFFKKFQEHFPPSFHCLPVSLLSSLHPSPFHTPFSLPQIGPLRIRSIPVLQAPPAFSAYFEHLAFENVVVLLLLNKIWELNIYVINSKIYFEGETQNTQLRLCPHVHILPHVLASYSRCCHDWSLRSVV